MKPYRYTTEFIVIMMIFAILYIAILRESSKTTYSPYDYINKDTEEVLDMRWNN